MHSTQPAHPQVSERVQAPQRRTTKSRLSEISVSMTTREVNADTDCRLAEEEAANEAAASKFQEVSQRKQKGGRD